MPITILHTASLDAAARDGLGALIGGELEPCRGFIRLHHPHAAAPETVAEARHRFGFDINPLPEGFAPEAVGLLVTDMDSTLINIECVDEIADFAGRKPEVAAVTEAAMRGEIDFATSLTRRVAALKGLEEGALGRVYEERLQLNPGAETMLKGLREAGVRRALVSGGFTFFTERLERRLGLDYTRANVLEIQDGHLTGRVLGEIVGAEAKATFLHELCERLGIGPQQSIAMGDGANDLLMMAEAGLGIAYRAKPRVQAEADVVLNHCGLEGVLHLLGIEAP